MDLRKQRYGPNSYLKASQSRDYTQNFNETGVQSQFNRASFGNGGGFDSFSNQRTYKQEISHGSHSPLRSTSQDEARQIEQRHEELKRQIALKEKQLADMTGERETVQMLRKRLGLKDISEEDESLISRKGSIMESKRAFYQSVSPDNSSSMLPNMIGMKSTTYVRQNSLDKSSKTLITMPEVPASKFAQKYNQKLNENSSQQLQFHPTRLPTKNKKHSPLRDRSGSQEAVNDYTSYSKQKYSPFSKDRSGSSASPMNDRFAIQEGAIGEEESSDQHPSRSSAERDKKLINPQRVLPLKQSGRPFIEDTFKQPRSVPGNQFENARDKLYRERIEQMTLDNQSLQRRLNQVNAELDRIQTENEDIVRQYELADGDVQRLEKMLHYKDDVDAQNNIMKTDLQRMKDTNDALNKKVKEEEFRQAETANKLSQVNLVKNSTLKEHDSMNHDFNTKLNRLDILSRERASAIQQLTNLNIDLDRLTREENKLRHDNIDLEQAIARLQLDRRDLLEKIERLTFKYDTAVRDITFSRKHLCRDNDWHFKILTFKRLHLSLEIMIKRRKQATFSEINNYSIFDSKCHYKIRQLATRMEKVGHYQIRKALNKWYDNSLKPYKTRLQNEDISIMIDCNKLLSKTFYAWKHYQQNKIDKYHFKTNAIQKIWHRLYNESLREKKRAIDIWRHKRIFENNQVLRLKRIFQKSNNRRCEDAFQAWLRFSKELEYHCRVKILHMNFTKKVYLSHVFHEFRDQIKYQKQCRIRTLNAFFKGWQDYIRYNRHLMQANMAAIAFRQANEKYTKRAVFGALRQHSESKKFALVNHAVKNDFDVAISELSSHNLSKNQQILTKNKVVFIKMMQDQTMSRVGSYWLKWKAETHKKNFVVKTTVNSDITNLIIKAYKNRMTDAMFKWKSLVFNKEILKNMKIRQDMMSSIQNKTNEALSQDKLIRNNVEKDKTLKRRIIDKNFRKLLFRRLREAMVRWRGIVNNTKCQQDQVGSVVIKRMRCRLLKQAFDRYKEFYAWTKQHQKNEKRADYISNTLKLRSLRKMFNAICYYTKWMKRIKYSWHKVLNKFDYYQKMRAVKIWNEGSHIQFSDTLLEKQNELTDVIKDKQEALNNLQVQVHGQTVFVKSQQNNLKKKGYRQIRNAFMRQYTKNTERYFYQWKATIQFRKQCQNVMRRSIEHYKRNTFDQLHRVFLKFISDDRRRERLEAIKATQIENHDINLSIEKAKKIHNEVRSKQKADVNATNCVSQETEVKVLHTMEWMAQRNLTKVWRFKLRMIWEMWRTVLKEEKAFAFAVRNVIQKSLWKEGFHRIKHQSRDIDFTRRVHRMFYLYSWKGQRIKMGNALTKWKNHVFKSANNNKSSVMDELKQHQDNFDEFRNKVSETNMKRVCAFLYEKNLQNVFKAWKNVYKLQKLTKAKAVEFKQRQKKLQQKWALRTWSIRQNTTNVDRTKCNFVMNEYRKLYLRSCFNGWKRRYLNVKRLIETLSNLEKLQRGKVAYGDSFRILKSYTTSKALVKQNGFKIGINNLKALFHGIYIKKLNQAFQKYKDQCRMSGGGMEKFKGAYMKCFGKRLRDAFNWWKKKTNIEELKYDLYHTGPVRAEYWLAMRDIENMKQFMRDQHYTEDEIEKFYDTVSRQNDYLMKKYMTRFKYINDPKKRLLVFVVDRWKGWVAIRKNVKHQFRYLANYKESRKAELQMAFNKWRKGPDRLEQELWKLDIKTLENLGYRTTKELEECRSQVAENQAINNHLVLQRDEFLNYYIKGQVLAMALIKDRTEFAKMQSMSRWLRGFRKQYINEMKMMLRDDTNYLANQSERRDMLEAENKNMEEENLEMRQFSRDGEVVKRNKKRLQDECQGLKDHIQELEEEFRRMEEEKYDLLAKIQDQEDIKNNNKAQGKENTLKEKNKMGQIKRGPTLQEKVMNIEESETAEQKQSRLKLEQLEKIRRQGPGIRGGN